MAEWRNKLFFGDNLGVLRNDLADASVDLIYLDPPFNSKRDYNLLFKTPKGHDSDAQITAFEDSWEWGEQAEIEFAEILRQPNTQVAEMIQALRRFLGENAMLAYLTMMANRLLELHRVLKPTGSLYLHCDPTASHYLKIVLDAVFGKENYRNEIIWKRTTAHNDPKRFGRIHDVIFYFSKTDQRLFKPVFGDFSEAQMSRYKYEDEGGKFRAENLTAPSPSANRMFIWRGVNPGANRHWMYPLEKLEDLYAKGRILLQRDGKPRKDGLKIYLSETNGAVIQDIWDNIQFAPTSSERLGYPTQKPLALLERIIQASSNEGDVVLDPFCGCGTAVHAAQKAGRRWLGIDITHLAVGLIERRMKEAFPDIAFEVHGTPKDAAGARELAARDKYQFQWWACALVGAQPYQGKKKGADGGTDGLIFFQDERGPAKKIIVSVKGGDNVTRAQIADLKNTVERERAQIGLFVTLATPTKPMTAEAASAGFYESPHHGAFPKIQILTVAGIMSGHETPRYPDLTRGGLNFKRAESEPKGENLTLFD